MQLRSPLYPAQTFPHVGDIFAERLGRRSSRWNAEVCEQTAEAPGMDLGQFLQQQLQISQLEDELSRLLQRPKYASPTRTLSSHRAILETTKQLFPKARITVSEEADPEIEDDEYFVITVETPGSVDELVECHREWHRRVGTVAPETASAYRLSLDIND